MNFNREFRPISGSTLFQSKYKSLEIEKKPKVISEKAKIVKKEGKKAKEFITNKKKLKDRIFAFSSLVQSKKFTAFYSVSFPQGLPDKSAVKVLNNVLTNMRINRLKFNYLWVAERQKNGTMHFHILVNQFWNIRIINHKFAQAIDHEIIKEKLTDINYCKSTYNGCDVCHVRNMKGLRSYITKYISKNYDSFDTRSWACDRVVSALFTSISCPVGELPSFEKLANYYKDGRLINYLCDFANYYPLKHLNNNNLIKKLEEINNYISKNFELLKNKVVEEIEILVKVEPQIVESQQVLF